MNDKQKALLIKIAEILRDKFRWEMAADHEISLFGEGMIPMVKTIQVESSLDDKEISSDVICSLDLKLGSDDQITWYPDFTITGDFLVDGANPGDFTYSTNASTGFMEGDIEQDGNKFVRTASEINNIVDNYVQGEYHEYVMRNAEAISYYRKDGWKADDDAYRDR